jgi:hypothetical protein
MNHDDGMPTAPHAVMTMRWLLPVVTVALVGCNVCPVDRRVQTGYAAMASHGAEIAACIARKDCATLCTGLFALDGDAEVVRCKITELVLVDATVQPGPVTPSTDMTSALGVNVSVGYVEHNRCGASHVGAGASEVWYDVWGGDWTDDSFDDGWCADGWCDDDSYDDGSYDDGSYDDGSCDDGSCDDGSDDGDVGGDGSDDDGWDDGGSDDGGWDDGGSDDGGGGGDDGGGDDGGGDGGGGDGSGGDGGGDFRRAPPSSGIHAHGVPRVSQLRLVERSR